MKVHHNLQKYHMLPTFLALAGPTVLEQMMQTAVQYIDTAMVSTLGTQATAAVGATSTVNWLVNSSISALSVGFLSFVAFACGSGDKKSTSKFSMQAVLLTLVIGISLTVVTLSLSSRIPIWMHADTSIQSLAALYFFILYLPMLPRTASIMFGTLLRAAGDTKTPMYVGISVNVINIILNYFLIFSSREVHWFSLTFHVPGAGLGVVGAAIASAIAFTFGGIFITVKLWKHPFLSPRNQKFAFDCEFFKPYWKVTLPNLFQRFGTSLGYVAFASMINSLGDIATATHTIANTVESAFYIPAYGMQTATATLAGNAVGANDEAKLKDTANVSIKLELFLMTLSGSLLFLFAKFLMSIFSKDPEVILLGTRILRMVAISEPIYGIAVFIEGMMLGIGQTMTPFKFNIFGMWGIRILGTFICTQILDMTLVAAWGSMILHNFVLFLLFTFYYKHGSWNPLSSTSKTDVSASS